MDGGVLLISLEGFNHARALRLVRSRLGCGEPRVAADLHPAELVNLGALDGENAHIGN